MTAAGDSLRAGNFAGSFSGFPMRQRCFSHGLALAGEGYRKFPALSRREFSDGCTEQRRMRQGRRHQSRKVPGRSIDWSGDC
jgi:hypothetical protein